jgi:FHA domain
MQFKDFLGKAQNFLNTKVRPFIDGTEETELPNNSGRNEAEEFLARVSQTISNLMEENKFLIPNGKVYVPDSYIVYLSPEKDKVWQGRKRSLFIEGLEFLCHEYASRIAGESSMALLPIKIKLLVDGTLRDNSVGFSVRVVLDNSSKTDDSLVETATPKPLTQSNKHKPTDEVTTLIQDDEKTVVLFDDNEMTVVVDTDDSQITEIKPFYYLDIMSKNELQDSIPVSKNEVRIGRPSRTSNLDIKLINDKVSRHHANLNLDEKNNIWLTHFGQNPTKIDGKPCNDNEKTLVKANQNIEIGDFVLVIKK